MRLVVVAILAGCGGGPRSTQPPAPATLELLAADPDGLRPGEQASYAMTLAGVEVGEAAFAVGLPGVRDGRREIVVASRAAGTGLVSFVRELAAEGESRIDARTGWPIHAEGVLIWGGRRFRGDLDYAAELVDGGWYNEDDELIEAVYRNTYGPPMHNVHSAAAAVRAWNGEPGERRELYLHGAIEIWRAELEWVGREVIGTTKGNLAAIRIDGTCLLDDDAEWAIHLQIWISDDADRVPLRMTTEVWKFETTFELTDYQRPAVSS